MRSWKSVKTFFTAGLACYVAAIPMTAIAKTVFEHGWNFFEKGYDRRIDNTFKLYNEYFNNIASLEIDLEKVIDSEPHFSKIKKSKNQKEIDDYFIKKIDLPNKEKLLRIAAFYAEVEECAKTNLCDEKLVRKLFQEKGTAFYTSFDSFFIYLIQRGDYTGAGRAYHYKAHDFYGQPQAIAFRKNESK